MLRRPARTTEERSAIAAELRRQAEGRREPPGPSIVGDAIQIFVSTAVLLGHLALVGLGGYGVWYEVTVWGGGVAFLSVIAAIVGIFGTWQSAEGLMNRTWQALRVLAFTIPAVALLVFIFPFLTWSRSGP